MTAFITICHSDRIEIFADTIATGMDGKVISIASKFYIDHERGLVCAFRSADAFRISTFFRAHIMPMLTADIDETLAKIRSALPNLRPYAASLFPDTVLIAGRGKAGFRHALLSTQSPLGVPSLDLVQLQSIMACGNMDDAEMATAGLDLRTLSIRAEDRAPKFFQAFRKPVPLASGIVAGVVGGQLEHVTIRRDAIESRIIGYWPDWIGRTIDPSRKFVPII
jgi:hypothetical protein